MRPSEIINAHRTSQWDGTAQTHTGSINLLSPQPCNVNIVDIAQGLAYKFRWEGQIMPLTCAEHSMLVSDIIQMLWPESEEVLGGLLHNAAQAYLGALSSPMRHCVHVAQPRGIIEPWGSLRSRLNGIVAKAFSLEPGFGSTEVVKAADILAVSLEKSQWPGSRGGLHKGLPEVPPQIAHFEVSCLEPAEAKVFFLDRYRDLTK